MKQQFRALFLMGLIFSVFSLTSASNPDISQLDNNAAPLLSGLVEFSQGVGMALIQPFGGFNGLDDESNTYIYQDGYSSSYKNGGTVGLFALTAIICKVIHAATR